jgi:hypothetical protein
MMETIWTNPEYRTEGELVDSVVKKYQSGIASLRQAREDVGYSATQIDRLEVEDAKAASAAMDPIIARALRPDGQEAPAPAVPASNGLTSDNAATTG